jgi:hypothetical protein
VVDTFGDTIDREMLSHELAAELDGKAEQTALAAETAARETLAETVAQKCECYFGTYTGDGAVNRTIELGFSPKAVLLLRSGYLTYYNYVCGGLAVEGAPVSSAGITFISVSKNGFQLSDCTKVAINVKGDLYSYIAFR